MSKSIRRSLLTAVTGTVALGAVLAAAGCSGVGNGNSLESIHIVPSGFASNLEAAKKTYAETPTFLCSLSNLVLIGTFSDSEDSLGTFTSRGTWTSSNPSVVKISNGELANPLTEGTLLPAGTLLPVAEGSSTITAKYLDLSASIVVNVKPIDNVHLEPVNPTVAVHTTQGFSLFADVAGLTLDLAGLKLVQAELTPKDDTVATLTLATATGNPLVTGLKPTDGLNLAVTLPICGRTFNTSVRVAQPTSIVLEHEPGFSGDLVLNLTESLVTKAVFEGGAEQDVSGFASYVLATDDTTASTRVSLGGSIATALAAGAAVPVKASCCVRDLNGDGDTTDEGETATQTSNELLIQPVTGDLTSFTIAPLDASLFGTQTLQYTATGTFDNGARTLPMTRSAVYSTSDVTAANFFGFIAGQVQAVGVLETKTTTVTVTPSTLIDGTTTTAPVTTTLTVNPSPLLQ